MKITKIHAKSVELKLIEPFVTAALTRTHQSTVLVKVETDEGVFGIGESVATRHIVGETIDSILASLKELEIQLIGINPLNIELIHSIMDKYLVYNSGAKAGIDIALYDIKGKIMNAPLYKVLGGFRNTLETDVTISIDSIDNMVSSALKSVNKGFKELKIKIGLDPKKDIEAIKRIREAVGSDVSLKADANQGYSITDAIIVLNEILKYDIILTEQPVPYWDINGMAQIRSKTNMPVVADEAVHNHYDAMKYIKSDACDMVNIKLMKSAGIFKAEKINAVCEASNIRCMVGCMVESRVAIAAGAHFAASKKNIIETDLDAFLLTEELPYLSGGFTNKNGNITLLESPGLGLEVEF